MSILSACLLSAALVFLAISFAVLASGTRNAHTGEEDESASGPVKARVRCGPTAASTR
jgi:hypothetical protein